MIETEETFGITTIQCDGCSYEEEFEGPDGHSDFQKAIKEAKERGWIIRNVDGEWVHYHDYECFENSDL